MATPLLPSSSTQTSSAEVTTANVVTFVLYDCGNLPQHAPPSEAPPAIAPTRKGQVHPLAPPAPAPKRRKGWVWKSIDEYMAHLAHKLTNGGTLAGKRSRLKQFFAWALEEAKLDLHDWRDVTPQLVDRYVQHRLNSVSKAAAGIVQPATVARGVEALKAWLAWNEEREFAGPIRSQYLSGRVKSRANEDKFALSPAQQAQLLELAKLVEPGQKSLWFIEPGTGKRKSAWCAHWPKGAFHAFCRIGLVLGLRPRELFWIAWEDFSETSRQVTLEVRPHFVERDGRKLVVNNVKTAQSRRRLVVPPDLWAELTELRKSLKQAGDVRPFVFAVKANKGSKRDCAGWQPPEIGLIFKALKRELGDDRLVANTLRKTCGTNLRRTGADYFAVAALLGHAPETTLKHYVAECNEREALDPSTGKVTRMDDE